MKWVCVVALVLDILLVAGAAYRLAIVPKKDVAVVEDRIVSAIDEADAVLERMKSEQESYLESGGDFEYDYGAGDSAEEDASGVDYKNIDLNERTLETYDDQAAKEEALGDAKDEINRRFGSN